MRLLLKVWRHFCTVKFWNDPSFQVKIRIFQVKIRISEVFVVSYHRLLLTSLDFQHFAITKIANYRIWNHLLDEPRSRLQPLCSTSPEPLALKRRLDRHLCCYIPSWCHRWHFRLSLWNLPRFGTCLLDLVVRIGREFLFKTPVARKSAVVTAFDVTVDHDATASSPDYVSNHVSVWRTVTCSNRAWVLVWSFGTRNPFWPRTKVWFECLIPSGMSSESDTSVTTLSCHKLVGFTASGRLLTNYTTLLARYIITLQSHSNCPKYTRIDRL